MFDMTTFASSTFEIKWSDDLTIHVYPVTLSDSYKIQNIGFNSNNLSLEEHYNLYEKQGLEKKEIIKKIAKDRNVNKNEIYQKFIKK